MSLKRTTLLFGGNAMAGSTPSSLLGSAINASGLYISGKPLNLRSLWSTAASGYCQTVTIAVTCRQLTTNVGK
jgi:hypothetical protein